MNEQPKLAQTQFEALRSVGFFRAIDAVVSAGLLLYWAVSALWNFLVYKGVLVSSYFNLNSVLLSSILVVVLWIVVLVFRCTHFVLMLTASVKLMPYEAARIVSAWKVGGIPE